MRRWLAIGVAVGLLAACSSDDGADDGGLVGTLDVTVANAQRCDPIADGCLLPFPNDHFTVADDTTATGRRVQLDARSMPTNADGTGVDPSAWNHLDGFSPGAALLLQIPELDLTASGTAPITDIQQSLADDAPIVLLDSDTGERLPYWVEADSYAPAGEVPTTFVRPAISLPEGHRIVVGVRGLIDTAGREIAPAE
ncbi:MAG: hypothetical protein Q8K72_19195, partial [Acidimicrobiales bacterium]|nr:hypothetical protein [Acidimicrobiales bacterium]